ncbi:MAG: AAA family ATPase [Leptothrix sp. (in: b-proteobacteria)]
MYASFFGLKQEPFSIAPDPRYLYMSERHREALAHLVYGIDGGGGFVVLTGEIGAGKTTVCRCFLEQVPLDCNVAYIFNPKLSVHEMLKAICDEFGVPPADAASPRVTVQDHVGPLNQFLLDAHAAGRKNVLVIDEAQNLSPTVLEQLRLLTNLETAERKLLQIVLIGQPELRTMLARPDLEQLAQRVIASYHLEPLSEIETALYILHRLRIAGLGTAVPFDRREMQRIHRLSRGVPRRINLLCDRALLGAYAGGSAQVGRQIIDKAAREVFVQGDAARGWRHAPLLRWGISLGSAVALVSVVMQLRTPNAAAPAVTAPAAATASAMRPGVARAPFAAEAASGGVAVMDATSAASAPALAYDRLDLATSWRNDQLAWRALSPSWGALLGDGDACAEVRKQQLACYRANGSLAQLRQLDRPALLTLIDSNNQRSWVLLDAIGEHAATLRTSAGTVNVPLSALAERWRGEFATLWRTPPGYIDKTPGASPAVDQWLSRQLSALQQPGSASANPGAAQPAYSLQSRLYAFQVAQELQPDGLAGPVTLMKLNRAIGIDEPRLTALR